MKKILFLILLLLISINIFSQSCNIISKANNIMPDKLCSPVTATWNVSYTGVNNAGSLVQIRYDWDNGVVQTVPAVQTAPGEFYAISSNIYTSAGNVCNYHPRATLVVNGVLCTSSTQEQIVTVWDNDDHNGGHMHINPTVYPICFGNGANVQFQDLTQFNCVPPQENDVPNLFTRWVQWIYGTDITMTGTPVTVNGNSVVFPYTTSIITLPGPVTGSGILSDILNVANDKLIGQYFQVTLRNWNYCNPYDDPNIPGPPLDLINGDHPPVTTTAIILIVDYPDATINQLDTVCVDSPRIYLRARTNGGMWTGPGVIANYFYPNIAGVGTHIINYSVTNSYGCSSSDTEDITVLPLPVVNINKVGTVFLNSPPLTLSATPLGGTFSGSGVSENIFTPSVGLGTHIIQYQTLPDQYGCLGHDTIHIQVILPDIPTSNWEPDTTGCAPLTIQFRNLSIGGETYLWDFGDKMFSTEQNPIHTYYMPGNYIVRLTVTNVAGSDFHQGLITVFQNPIALFNVYPTSVINNSQIVRFDNFSFYGNIYKWEFGDGEYSYDQNPWHKYENSGQYYVTLWVTSIDGCIDSLTYTTPIIVDYKDGRLRFPNVFKWNGSGPTGGYWVEGVIDDCTFYPAINENIIEYKLQIFNRWGTLIYESTDLHKGWDGYYHNEVVPQGVYVWKATGRYANGEYFDKVGDVTFLR